MKKIYLLIIIILMVIANAQLGCNEGSYKGEYKEILKENIELKKAAIESLKEKDALEMELFELRVKIVNSYK